MEDKKLICFFNKKNNFLEQGMLKRMNGSLFLLTNNSDFAGCVPHQGHIVMEGYSFSWWLGSFRKHLSSFKNIQEINQEIGFDISRSGNGSYNYCNFRLFIDKKNNFKKIEL